MTDGAGVPTGTPLSDPPLIEQIRCGWARHERVLHMCVDVYVFT